MCESTETLCAHCSLPTGILEVKRSLEGKKNSFCCYGCCLAYQIHHGKSDEPQAAGLLIRLGVGGFLAMNIMLFSLLLYSEVFNPLDFNVVHGVHIILWILTTPVLIILGGPFIHNAWICALQGKSSSDTLIALGSCSAYGYSVASILTGGQDVYFDTVTMVLVLFTLGRYLEAAGRAHCARSLEPMMMENEGNATVIVNKQTKQIPTAKLLPGMTLSIAAGERIASDGIVTEGNSQIDESMLTGESSPVKKSTGSTVLAGTINGESRLLIEATVTGSSTRWACICRSVREALARKSPMQKIADQVATYFVPIVLLLAALTIFYHSKQGAFSDALLAGVAVLVVACPCALGLATPLATSLGIGNAARRGCLIRGGVVFEALNSIRAVAFDKTGTLTSGQTRVIEIISDNMTEKNLLQHAATLEQGCLHPTAKGIVNAANLHNLLPKIATQLRDRPGLGIEGKIDNVFNAIGSEKLMKRLNWDFSPNLLSQLSKFERLGYTQVFVGWDGHVRGAIVLEDELIHDARKIVEQIHQLDMETCLLSGDAYRAVQSVSSAVGIDHFSAELSPEDKVKAIKQWAEKNGNVLMVGDGLNDGPVLSVATVGVAVASATDLIREVADVVLPPGGLDRLPWLLSLSKKVQKIIVSNLFWAFSYNIVALSLAVTGLLQPILAAALMAGSSLIVVFNSLRLKYYDDYF